MTILLATNNPHKAEELAAILAGSDGLRVLTLRELDRTVPEPVEDGASLEANAYIKAHEIHTATGLPVIADDTGLEVAALGGAPGIISARYAGEDASYADNCRRLLAELEGAGDRSARFRTVICYVDQYRTLFAEGSVDGEIMRQARGEGGFGYDPLFLPAGSERTFAEMSAAEKNRISHRGRALVQLRGTLAPYLAEEG